MPIVHLDEMQNSAATPEQKERFWIENVWQRHAPQLTLRALLTGAVLGGLLSMTSLYLGAKIGWIPSVGIIAGVVAFAFFRILSRLGLGRELGLLENNLSQTVAGGAAFMAAPLVSSLGAYMVVTQTTLPVAMAAVWMCTVALAGVLLAIPLKRRFIDGGEYPFPEGQATAVVLDALHAGDVAVGALKAKVLLIAAGVAGVVRLWTSQTLLAKMRAEVVAIPQYLDDWIYGFVTPKLLGIPLRDLTVRVESDVVLMAVGGLMGMRTGVSLLLGACVNYLVLAPLMISHHQIQAMPGSSPPQYGFAAIMMWSLWPGVALMASASLFPLLARPRALIEAVRGLWSRSRRPGGDAKTPGRLPTKLLLFATPAVATAVVLLARFAFGVPIWVTLAALPLVAVSTFLAVNATALTSVTPSGALAMLTQLGHGLVAPAQLGTTIGTAALTSDASANASNLLMSLRSGRMLGASAGPQVVGHLVGVVVGTLVTIPIFWLVFLHAGPAQVVSEQFPLPGVTMWAAVARAITLSLNDVAASARLAALVGLVLGCLIEAAESFTHRRLGLSGVGFGLAFVIPFSTSLSMFLGALFFWLATRSSRKAAETVSVVNAESVAAGAIAGGALVGMLVALAEVVLS